MERAPTDNAFAYRSRGGGRSAASLKSRHTTRAPTTHAPTATPSASSRSCSGRRPTAVATAPLRSVLAPFGSTCVGTTGADRAARSAAGRRSAVSHASAVKTSRSTDSASLILLGAFFYRPRASLRNEADEMLVVLLMTRATAPSSSARLPRSPASTLTACAITGSA